MTRAGGALESRALRAAGSCMSRAFGSMKMFTEVGRRRGGRLGDGSYAFYFSGGRQFDSSHRVQLFAHNHFEALKAYISQLLSN